MLCHKAAKEAIHIRDNNRNSPAHDAALHGQKASLKLLIEHGLNPNQPNMVRYAGFLISTIGSFSGSLVSNLLEHSLHICEVTINFMVIDQTVYVIETESVSEEEKGHLLYNVKLAREKLLVYFKLS